MHEIEIQKFKEIVKCQIEGWRLQESIKSLTLQCTPEERSRVTSMVQTMTGDLLILLLEVNESRIREMIASETNGYRHVAVQFYNTICKIAFARLAQDKKVTPEVAQAFKGYAFNESTLNELLPGLDLIGLGTQVHLELVKN
jgi:hypothetical protein